MRKRRVFSPQVLSFSQDTFSINLRKLSNLQNTKSIEKNSNIESTRYHDNSSVPYSNITEKGKVSITPLLPSHVFFFFMFNINIYQ